MKKCNDKNEIKKSPESAIATFFAIEDFSNVELLILKFLLTVTKLLHRTIHLKLSSYLESIYITDRRKLILNN
jgi:hypothetical protein